MFVVGRQGVPGAGVLMGRIVGMGDVFLRPLFVGALVMVFGLVELGRKRLIQCRGNRGLNRGRDRCLGLVTPSRHLGCGVMSVTGIIVLVIMVMVMVMVIVVRVLGVVRFLSMVMRVIVLMVMLMTIVIMMRGLGVDLALMRVFMLDGC